MRRDVGTAVGSLGLPQHIQACLFDLDGVLTQTANVHRAAWKETFDPLLERVGQAPFSEADYLRYVDGKRRLDGVRDFLASRSMATPEDRVVELSERKNALVHERLERDGVEVYDGSVRYLQMVRAAGLPVAVVTASANAPAVLSAARLSDAVDVRIDGTVARDRELSGKPAPDTFLAAADELGIDPGRGAVFEDALSGVAAGRAGGFGWVVGVDRAGQAEALAAHGADVVVRDLAELLTDPDD